MPPSPSEPTTIARTGTWTDALGTQLLEPHGVWRRTTAVAAVALPSALLWWGTLPAAVGAVGAGWDKLAHAGFHFVLCWLILFALGWRRRRWAVPLCAAFAALDEFTQYFHPGRSVEFADWAAGVAGALIALALARALAWWSEMRRLQRALPTRP